MYVYLINITKTNHENSINFKNGYPLLWSCKPSLRDKRHSNTCPILHTRNLCYIAVVGRHRLWIHFEGRKFFAVDNYLASNLRSNNTYYWLYLYTSIDSASPIYFGTPGQVWCLVVVPDVGDSVPGIGDCVAGFRDCVEGFHDFVPSVGGYCISIAVDWVASIRNWERLAEECQVKEWFLALRV